jgi:hypothetical protein
MEALHKGGGDGDHHKIGGMMMKFLSLCGGFGKARYPHLSL